MVTQHDMCLDYQPMGTCTHCITSSKYINAAVMNTSCFGLSYEWLITVIIIVMALSLLTRAAFRQWVQHHILAHYVDMEVVHCHSNVSIQHSSVVWAAPTRFVVHIHYKTCVPWWVSHSTADWKLYVVHCFSQYSIQFTVGALGAVMDCI